TGGGGGLQPGVSFTASITNGSMVVTAVDPGDRKLSLNQTVIGPGLPAKLTILGGPNPGLTGTYRVAVGTAFAPGTIFATTGGAQCTGNIGFPGVDTLNVDSMITGTITIGDVLTSPPAMPAGTSIIAQLTGTTGGVGSYQVLVGGTQVNCASQPLK